MVLNRVLSESKRSNVELIHWFPDTNDQDEIVLLLQPAYRTRSIGPRTLGKPLAIQIRKAD